jgi:hypothetical protein
MATMTKHPHPTPLLHDVARFNRLAATGGTWLWMPYRGVFVPRDGGDTRTAATVAEMLDAAGAL